MSKPKVGFYWCASCGGCEEAVVDLAEDVLRVVEAVDIAFWPVALDFKRADVAAMADGEMAVCFVNGAVRTSEQEEMARLMRLKSQLIIAFGSCSHMGGIPGLANMTDRETLLRRVYQEVPSVANPDCILPQERCEVSQGSLTLPALHDTVSSLDQMIPVDYYLPGCPPPVKLIKDAVTAILQGAMPPKGSVLAPDVALCTDCPRKDSKPERLLVSAFKRPHEIQIDPAKCLLEQGLLCMGPVTRSGCDAACIDGNMPCTGCLGPTGRVRDFGAKALSAVASIADATEESKIAGVLDKIVDPIGTFYRYSLPTSILFKRNRHDGNGWH
ncbi:MAG: oxidoreductase [candidate division Zixibacteria bacterium]|nr:oxidoreductase [candidate division Zixibacteria bacterium]